MPRSCGSVSPLARRDRGGQGCGPRLRAPVWADFPTGGRGPSVGECAPMSPESRRRVTAAELAVAIPMSASHVPDRDSWKWAMNMASSCSKGTGATILPRVTERVGRSRPMTSKAVFGGGGDSLLGRASVTTSAIGFCHSCAPKCRRHPSTGWAASHKRRSRSVQASRSRGSSPVERVRGQSVPRPPRTHRLE